MKKILSITGIASTFLLIGVAFGFSQKDFGAEKAKLLKLSAQALQEARLYSCKQIGDLTADCYKTGEGAVCDQLHAAEELHLHHFMKDAYSDCTGPQVAPAAHGMDCPEGQILSEQEGKCIPEQSKETEVSTPEGGLPAGAVIQFPGDQNPSVVLPVDPLFRGDEEGN